MSTESSPVLRIGRSSESPLQASKWLQTQLLIDEDEMQSLFSVLQPFYIFSAGAVCNKDEGVISQTQFLTQYAKYIRSLSNGEMPNEEDYRQLFSTVFSISGDDLFQVEIPQERRIIRIAKPVLQLQMNKIGYSSSDHKFRGMMLGLGGIIWGLQFSYPQLFRDAITAEVYKVYNHPEFPNGMLYKKLQQWIRQATRPTPFQVEGRLINASVRLGKNCFSWINRHPQLLSQGIKVVSKA